MTPTLHTSGPRATDIMKCAWQDGPWQDPGRGGGIGAASFPVHECPEIPTSPALGSQHTPAQVFD